MREFIRPYSGLPLRSIRPMVAATFAQTLAEVEDMVARTRLQLQYLSKIHDEVIARHIEYGRQTAQGDHPEISETSKPPVQVLFHASCDGTTSAHVKKTERKVARPGRCHQCARVESPEWRRGPGGLRSLCDACGVHYAKRERRKRESVAGAKW
jgi:hypothetical protein